MFGRHWSVLGTTGGRLWHICYARDARSDAEPNSASTKDFASIFGAHIVSGLVSELPGMGINTALLGKKSGNRLPSLHHFAMLS